MKSMLIPLHWGTCLGSLALAFGLLSGCGSEPNDHSTGNPTGAGAQGTGGGGGSGNGPTGSGGSGGSAGAPNVTCTPTVAVAPDSRSFVVTDPEVLAKFSLERVLQKLITDAGDASTTQKPLDLFQRLFDTENNAAGGAFADVAHCDEFSFAFINAAPTSCPRAEGALAKNPNLLTAGDPNSFVPVAIVNRLDLTRQSGMACGEQRIVYAKLSGKTNPEDRVFIIFEAALLNWLAPNVMGCQPVAEMWASLEKETDIQAVANKLENFFFTGLPNFGAVVHADNYGGRGPDEDGPYGGSHGQVRVGHKMQVPWEWREFQIRRTMTAPTPLIFRPVTAKNNPIPERFDMAATPGDEWFRQEFLNTTTQPLAAASLQEIRMQPPGKSNMGQSAFEGAAATDYATRGSKSPGNDFASRLDEHLVTIGAGQGCPTNDPLTGKNILQRASMLTCAGCHAPQQFLEPDRSIGCGLTWPESLGEVHIDENGKLSPALKDVFLPQRAKILSSYVGGCSAEAMMTILPPAEPGDGMGIPK